jgi:NAD(P)-dependent dehydrogenase (short-subunit alcohol dehydrogenase family)
VRGLRDKGVLVCGGTRGIGLAAARRFVAEGARVFIVGLDRGELDAALAALEGADGCVCDASDPEQVAHAIAAAERWTGGLSILANNAGIAQRQEFLQIGIEDWDRIIRVNLRGMFVVAQAFARLLVESGRPGSIINMASTNGLGAEADYAHYNASKGGVIQLTRSMAVELGGSAIRVNALCPGYIATPLNAEIADGLETDFVERYARERIPLGRVGTVDEVAAVYAFLASDDASFIHGATIVVDGGQLAVM